MLFFLLDKPKPSSVVFTKEIQNRTMQVMSYIQIRMDSDEKDQVKEVLSNMGLTVSGAVKIFLRKVVQEGKIPFELHSKPVETPKNAPKSTKKEEDPNHYENAGWTTRKIGS